MAEIQVRAAGGVYPVHVGREVLERHLAGDLARFAHGRVAVVSHPSLLGLHGQRLNNALEAGLGGLDRVTFFLFPAGEENKSLETLAEGYEVLLAGGIGREDTLLAFGGGVVGDLGGFLAATFMRGIRYAQVPTTLMSMVDSAIGGKVGIDLPGAKNAVGSFHQPLAVYSDVDFLATLPEREMRSGLAEVAKYGLLYDQGLLRSLEAMMKELPRDRSGLGVGQGPLRGLEKMAEGGQRDGAGLEGIIARCAALKAGVVEADERDLGGKRAMLNYGHTFAHALESACGYGNLRHGEAVAVGMMMAARLAEIIGLCEQDLSGHHLRVLRPLIGKGKICAGIDRERILSDMKKDKKKGESLRFVLLEEPQKPRLVEGVPPEAVVSAVEETLEYLRRADP